MAQEYQVGWKEGWDSLCESTLLYLGASELYYQSSVVTLDSCKQTSLSQRADTSYMDKARAEGFSEEDWQARRAGQQAGSAASFQYLFSQFPYLCYGTECVTKNDLIDAWGRD